MFDRKMIWTAAWIAMVSLPLSRAWAEGDEKAPKVVVRQRTVDIGRLQEGDHGSAKFTIENGGTADLHIESVTASCGCTVPRTLSAEERRVEPSEKLEIEVSFNSQGRRGLQKKSITVRTDDPLEPRLQLYLNAEVVTLFEVLVNGRQMRRLSFGRLSPGKMLPETIEVLPTEPDTVLAVDSLESMDPALMFRTEPITRDTRTGVSVDLSIDPSASLGQVSTSLVIHARVGDEESRSHLAIMGEVIGVLNYRPLIIKRMQPVLPGNSLPPLTITSNDSDVFEIMGVEAGHYIEPEIEKRTESHYQIQLKIKNDAPQGPFGTYLDVRTNLVDQPLIRVPVYGSVLPPVTAEPAVVLLKAGDVVGSSRTVKIEASNGMAMTIAEILSDQPYVTAKVVEAPGRASVAMKHVAIEVNGDVPSGAPRTANIRVRTSLNGEPEAVIPVTVLVQ